MQLHILCVAKDSLENRKHRIKEPLIHTASIYLVSENTFRQMLGTIFSKQWVLVWRLHSCIIQSLCSKSFRNYVVKGYIQPHWSWVAIINCFNIHIHVKYKYFCFETSKKLVKDSGTKMLIGIVQSIHKLKLYKSIIIETILTSEWR